MKSPTNSRIGLKATGFLCAVLFFLMINEKISGQNNWVYLGDNFIAPGHAEISDLTSSSDSLTFFIKFNGFYVDSIDLNDTLYQDVRLPGEFTTPEPGMPSLPLIRKLVSVPECSGIDADFVLDSVFVLNNYNIKPSYQYIDTIIEGNPALLPVFHKDQTVYQSNQWYPANQLVVNSTGALRAQRLVEIFFYPFQFNPLLKQLRVCKGITVKVLFENPMGKVNSELGIFRNVARHSTINYQLDELGPTSQLPGTGEGSVNWYSLSDSSDVDHIKADYLIITAGKFFNQYDLQSETYRIAKHRADYNGYDVAILNVENIVSDAVGLDYSGGTLPSGIPPDTFKIERRIRTCIKRLYENNLAQHTADGKLAFVLLVGDGKEKYTSNYLHEGVPPAFEKIYTLPLMENTPTDYYYACLTNYNNQYDWYGDVFIGRFPADNTTELHNIVEKTIRYETETNLSEQKRALYHTGTLDAGSSQLNYMEDSLGFNYEFIPRIVTSPNTYIIRDCNSQSSPATMANVISDINNGVNLYSYYDHSNSYLLGSTDTTYFQDNLSNTFKNPFFFAYSCNNGAYNDNLYNRDCFSEVMMTYSPSNGFVGSFASYSAVLLETSPSLPITPTTFYELFQNNLWSNFAHFTGELVLMTKNLHLTTPFLGKTNPQFNFNLLCDPALNLFPKGYQISQNQTIEGDIYISTPVTVKSGFTLTINSGTNIHFVDKGSLTIEEDAAIVFNNTAILTGINDNNYLLVKGAINKLNNLTFTALNGNHWNGLYISNPGLVLTVNSTTSFTHCGLRGRWQSLTVNGTAFNDSWLSVVESNVDIQNSTFEQSYVIAENEGGSKSAGLQIKNCIFSGTPNAYEAIRVEGYPIFNIENNSITYSGADGIALYRCGSLASRAHFIRTNEITYNGAIGGFNNGIKVYNCLCGISGNNIHNNPIGISFLNLTSGTLTGNSTALNSIYTQRIVNNLIYQLYLSNVSSAPEIKWNAIMQDINSASYPFIRYDQVAGYSNPTIDVSFNYWGNNFLPQSDLIPFNKFNYTPLWPLPGKSAQVDSTGQELFETAIGMEADSNYVQAESIYKMVIDQYPGSGYAIASMNHLFWISDYIFSNQQEYKQYFLSDNVIVSHPHLKRVGQWLANSCDITLGEYVQAELWLDSIVQNPSTVSDSLYALIDLAWLLTRFDTAVRKEVVNLESTGSMPETKIDFFDKRQQWVDLLYNHALKTDMERNEQNSINTVVDEGLIRVFPNPANEKLFVEISVENEDVVNIQIISIFGQSCLEINHMPLKSGRHIITIDLAEVKSSVGAGMFVVNICTLSEFYVKKVFIK